jgi:hypothetical protein
MRSFLFCLSLLLPLVGYAQEFKKISCRFLCLDAENPVPPLLNVGEKGAEIPCTVHTAELSPAVACSAKDQTLTFLSAADRKPAATAKIPDSGKAFILIFVAAAKAPDALPWRVFVIEDSPANFPDGGAYVANFHNQDIRFVLGDKKLMLRSGTSHGFARPTQLDSFNMAPVSFEFQQNGTWRVAKESMQRFLPGTRYLFFAYVDPTSGRPRISTYRDLTIDAKPQGSPDP